MAKNCAHSSNSIVWCVVDLLAWIHWIEGIQFSGTRSNRSDGDARFHVFPRPSSLTFFPLPQFFPAWINAKHVLRARAVQCSPSIKTERWKKKHKAKSVYSDWRERREWNASCCANYKNLLLVQYRRVTSLRVCLRHDERKIRINSSTMTRTVSNIIVRRLWRRGTNWEMRAE